MRATATVLTLLAATGALLVTGCRSHPVADSSPASTATSAAAIPAATSAATSAAAPAVTSAVRSPADAGTLDDVDAALDRIERDLDDAGGGAAATR